MKNILLSSLFLIAITSCKKEVIESSDPKRLLYSFEILDKEGKSIFEKNQFIQDSILFKITNTNGTVINENPSFRKVSNKIISKAYYQIGSQEKIGNDYIFTTYIYLNKSDTDTLKIVIPPSSIRDIGSGEGEFPTSLKFFYNDRISQEYDFVKNPELLQFFWQTDGVGQIVSLKK